MNEVAIGILQAVVVITASWVVFWLVFQLWLRVMYQTRWKHE